MTLFLYTLCVLISGIAIGCVWKGRDTTRLLRAQNAVAVTRLNYACTLAFRDGIAKGREVRRIRELAVRCGTRN